MSVLDTLNIGDKIQVAIWDESEDENSRLACSLFECEVVERAQSTWYRTGTMELETVKYLRSPNGKLMSFKPI
jgi:hypothetical protein